MKAEACRKGHLRTPENAKQDRNGHWHCRVCKSRTNAAIWSKRSTENGFRCPCCRTTQQNSPRTICAHCRLECERGMHKEK